MKVALVMPTHFDKSSVIAGGERYAYGLAKALSELCPTRLFTFGNKNSVERDGNLEIEFSKILFQVGGIANPFSLHYLRNLRDYDVVHCLQYPTVVSDFALLCGAALKKKLFVTDLAGGTHYCLSRFFPIWKKVSMFLYISEFNRNLNLRYVRPYKILYGGVDTHFFKPSENSRVRSGFLFVGRIFYHKGVHDLIEAAPEDVPVSILGTCHDSQYLERLKNSIGQKKISIREGESDSALLRHYHGSLATVLPSLVDGGFTSAIESLACGTPVIGTRLGSLPEVVEDGVTGFLVPPSDPKALREKILFLQQNPKRAEEMGIEGRRRVEAMFTWEKVAKRCIEAYCA